MDTYLKLKEDNKDTNKSFTTGRPRTATAGREPGHAQSTVGESTGGASPVKSARGPAAGPKEQQQHRSLSKSKLEAHKQTGQALDPRKKTMADGAGPGQFQIIVEEA